MFAAAWSYKEEIYDVVATPMNQAVDWLNEHKVEQAEAKLAAEPDLPRERYFDADGELVQPVSRLALSTAPGGMFFVYLKSTAYFSLFLGGPVLRYQMWMFIAAGLYKSERRMVLSYLPASLALFFGGVIFAFSVMVPYAIYFLNKDGLLQLELHSMQALGLSKARQAEGDRVGGQQDGGNPHRRRRARRQIYRAPSRSQVAGAKGAGYFAHKPAPGQCGIAGEQSGNHCRRRHDGQS